MDISDKIFRIFQELSNLSVGISYDPVTDKFMYHKGIIYWFPKIYVDSNIEGFTLYLEYSDRIDCAYSKLDKDEILKKLNAIKK